MVKAWLRRCWREYKSSVLDGRGAGVGKWHRALLGVAQSLVRYVKRVERDSDLPDLALWLMYHPESGVLPCEGWRMLKRPAALREELPELRRRYEKDRADVERRMGIVGTTAECLRADATRLRTEPTVAIHLHAYYPQLLPKIYAALEQMPCPYDLYVSVPEGREAEIRRDLPGLRECVVRGCPNRGRDIAPMVCLFGRELAEHEIVAHVHTKKSPHLADGSAWLGYELESLFGDRERMRGIVSRLKDGFGMVYAAENLDVSEDPTGWMRNRVLAESLVRKGGLSVDLARDYTPLTFPQGSIFWARSDFLRRFFDLPLSFSDFPPEPIPADGTPAHALERLFPIWGVGTGLRIARVTDACAVARLRRIWHNTQQEH